MVHYPLFSKVGERGYAEYQRLHMRKISWVVMPVMVLELVTAVLLLVPQLVGVEGIIEVVKVRSILWLNLAALGLIWVSTVLLQVPEHAKLTDGFERAAHNRLVRWNWIRTIIWSGRALGLLYLVVST